MSKIFVIAGNGEQARQWIVNDCERRWNARETSVSISDYVIVQRAESLKGLSDPHGVFVGTWRERDDIYYVIEALMIASSQPNPALVKILEEWRKNDVRMLVS